MNEDHFLRRDLRLARTVAPTLAPNARAFAEINRGASRLKLVGAPVPLDEPEWTKPPRRAWQPEPQTSRVLPWLLVSVVLVAVAWGVSWLI